MLCVIWTHNISIVLTIVGYELGLCENNIPILAGVMEYEKLSFQMHMS